jgi:hypothetical protein
MGGAQRYPSIVVREVDGFREGLNPSYALMVLDLIFSVLCTWVNDFFS